MKTLIKLAVGAAIAGALVNLLRKQWTGNREESPRDETITSEGSGFTIAELAGLDQSQAQVGTASPTATPL